MGPLHSHSRCADCPLIHLHRYFPPQALLHQLAHGLRVVFVVALQEHQFGDGTLYGHVAPTDDTSLLQMIAAVVARHLDRSLQALADIDDHLAVFRTLAEGVEQPRTLRGITRAEGAHDDGFQIRCVDDMADEVFANAWKEGEDDDVVVKSEVGRHGL